MAQHNLGGDIRRREDHKSIVLFVDRELKPLAQDLAAYAAKWKTMAQQAANLPVNSPYRQHVEEGARLAASLMSDSAELYPLARAALRRPFERVENKRKHEVRADSARANRAM